MKILGSSSATTIQLQKSKEVEKKGQKKIEAMTKALKELKAGVKAAKAINKKGEGTAAQIKDMGAAHKHVRAKPKAASKVPEQSSKIIGPEISDKFITIVGKGPKAETSYHSTLASARKIKPGARHSEGRRRPGGIYEITGGKKGKPVMGYVGAMMKSGMKYAWEFSNDKMLNTYGSRKEKAQSRMAFSAKFLVRVDGNEIYANSLKEAQKHVPAKPMSGKGSIFSLNKGKAVDKVMLWTNKDPITKRSIKGTSWFFTDLKMKHKYE